MKTITITICLAIILQFSAQTSVYADGFTNLQIQSGKCNQEKETAEKKNIEMSDDCKSYFFSQNLLPNIGKGIVYFVLGVIGFVVCLGGIEFIREKVKKSKDKNMSKQIRKQGKKKE